MTKQEVVKAIAEIEKTLAVESRGIERERLLERRACLRKGLERIAAHERTTR